MLCLAYTSDLTITDTQTHQPHAKTAPKLFICLQLGRLQELQPNVVPMTVQIHSLMTVYLPSTTTQKKNSQMSSSRYLRIMPGTCAMKISFFFNCKTMKLVSKCCPNGPILIAFCGHHHDLTLLLSIRLGICLSVGL